MIDEARSLRVRFAAALVGGSLACIGLASASSDARSPAIAQPPVRVTAASSRVPEQAYGASDARGFVPALHTLVGASAGDTASPAARARSADAPDTTMVAGGALSLAAGLAWLAGLSAARRRRRHDDERSSERRSRCEERAAFEAEAASRSEELRRLASHLQHSRERERAQLARELHDELGSLLIAAKLDVAYLARHLRSDDEVVRRKLAALRAALDQGIELKRRIIEDLRPSTLATLGLVPSLERLVADRREHFDGEIDCRLDEAIAVDEDAGLVIYRIAQEALTNVLKHAQARRIRLALGRAPGGVQLEVSDDGRGFDPEAVEGSRQGLAGMRHRLLAVGGALEIRSLPGRGTAVVARIPRSTAAGDQTRVAKDDRPRRRSARSAPPRPHVPART